MNNDEIQRLKSVAQIVRDSGSNESWSCYTILALIAKVESLAADAERYKEVRTWSPRKFTDVWELNIAGNGSFDELVDAMAKEKA